MILVLAGTTEGRELALRLQQEGYQNVVSVATDYGAKLMSAAGVQQVVVGRLQGQDWLDFLAVHPISLVVDASHPFALEVSRQAMAACLQMNTLYWRFERLPLPLPAIDLIHPVASLHQLLATALTLGNSWFSALGSKHLKYLVAAAHSQQIKLTARVLATKTVMEHCQALGLNDRQIITGRGPFTHTTNIQHYLQSGADIILTKESGINGGFNEKLTAAEALNLPIVVWQRPTLSYPRVVTNLDELLKLLVIYNVQNDSTR